MESGNSSSMQSSSGGGGGDDQEFESTGATATGNFFYSNPANPTQFHPSMQQFTFNNPPPQHNSYLDAFGDQSSYQNIMFWQQQQQQLQQQLGVLSGFPPPPSPPPALQDTHSLQATGNLGGVGSSSSAASSSQQAAAMNFSSTKPGTSTGPGVGPGSGAGGIGGEKKNTRKRTRASRRAPTTVLTTDTTNFRAMVQEFTGIPSSPFTAAASPLISRRLTDLFSGSSGSGAGSLRPGAPGVGVGSNLERLLAEYNTNFPSRPAAQKANTLTSSSNPTTSLLMNINTGTNPGTNNNAPLSLSTDQSIISNSSNNAINLPFQSLLQSSGTKSSPSETLRFNTSAARAAGGGFLSEGGTHFHDISGLLLGNDQNMSSTDTRMGGFPLMRLDGDTGSGGGSGNGWRNGSSDPSSHVHHNNDATGALNLQQISAADRNNNNDSNQQMEGSISGSGTSNSNYHHHGNVNVNSCSRDKGLDATVPSRGTTSNDQGTLGHFLD